MRNKKVKIIILVLLSVLSFVAIWPVCKSMSIEAKSSAHSNTVSFPFYVPKTQSFFQSAGLPLVADIKSYSLEIINPNNQYDISYHFSFGENDPFFAYASRDIYTNDEGIDGRKGIEIGAGKNYLIKNIPKEVLFLDAFGTFASCGFVSDKDVCPDSLTGWGNAQKVQLRACPNVDVSSLFSQLILIIIFWVVVINSTFEFFEIKGVRFSRLLVVVNKLKSKIEHLK